MRTDQGHTQGSILPMIKEVESQCEISVRVQECLVPSSEISNLWKRLGGVNLQVWIGQLVLQVIKLWVLFSFSEPVRAVSASHPGHGKACHIVVPTSRTPGVCVCMVGKGMQGGSHRREGR